MSSAKDQSRVALLQDSIKKLRDKLADQQRMMKLAEAQVDKVKRLETEIQRIKDAKVRDVPILSLCASVCDQPSPWTNWRSAGPYRTRRMFVGLTPP